MAAGKLLRGTRRYFTLRHLILFAMLAMLLFIVYTTFSRGNEYLMARSDFVRIPGSLEGTVLFLLKDSRGLQAIREVKYPMF